MSARQDGSAHEMIGTRLATLHALVRSQVDAINADDFAALERLTDERESLVAALGEIAGAEIRPADRALAEQVTALDQQLVELVRESLARTGQEIRDLRRGRGALSEYGRRGQNLIQNLAYLGRQD